MPSDFRSTLARRQVLQSLLGLGAWCVPAVRAEPTLQSIATHAYPASATGQNDAVFSDSGRLVVIFLRGAYDGLSAWVPHGDTHYLKLRPNIGIPAPDGTAQTTLKLDAHFGMHPAMASLLPLWQQGVLTFIPCAGSPTATRSHFEAQHHWETGVPGQSSAHDGWMNTLTRLRKSGRALSVGEANPEILLGSAAVQRVARGQAATRAGAMGDVRSRDAILKMYEGSDALSEAFRAGAQSRLQTTQTLNSAQSMQANASMAAADNGAGPAKGLLLDAQHLATLMQQDRSLRQGFLSAGGWDTHANQGATSGAVAQNLGDLAATLVQLRRQFSEPNDVVMVVSEFGRTSAENGTRGTDHGHGNALWLMGNSINGGRWHGQWQGLAQSNLHEGRDLPVLHDFRAIFAQVLRRTQGLNGAELDQIFAGLRWDHSLDGLLRA